MKHGMKSEIVIAQNLFQAVVDCEYFSCGFGETIRAPALGLRVSRRD
jgi:hypothetical protein